MKRNAVLLMSCLLIGRGLFAANATESPSWELTIPEGACTNRAAVTLTDGNYRLRGWIIDAEAKTLGIGDYRDSWLKDNDEGAELGLALMKAEDGAWTGSGDLDLRGALTVGGEASDWRITRLGKHAFNLVFEAPFDTFYCPTTLTGMSTLVFQRCGRTSSFHRLVLRAPGMTGAIPNNLFLLCKSLPVVELDIPKASGVDLYWNRKAYDDFLSETDVSTWDLSSLQYLVRDPNAGRNAVGSLFRWGSFRGTLRLPGLKWLNACALEHNRSMTALEVGRSNALVYVGSKAVEDCEALESVMLGGHPDGWVVSTNAFHSANIKNVTFLSVPPSFEESDSIVFGTETTPAHQMAFFIPRRDTPGWWKSWARFAKVARIATDAERADFASRFGAAAARGLVGVVAPEIFHTAQEQWLVCGVPSTERFAVNVSLLDPRFDGDAVEVSPLPDEDGCYAAGTEVTVSAKPNTEKGRFVRWRGAGIDESVETANPLTFTVDRDAAVVAQMAHDWTFRLNDSTTTLAKDKLGTISNQVWKLAVTVDDASKGTIILGTSDSARGSAWTEMGEGLLDLNGRILMESADGSYRELSVSRLRSFAFQGPTDVNNNLVIATNRFPRTVVMREEVTSYRNQSFVRAVSVDCAVTNLIYECPALAEKITGNNDFFGYRLTSARIRLPNVTSLFATYSVAAAKSGELNWTMSNTVDVTDWRLDSVTDVRAKQTGLYYGTLRGPFSDQSFTGTLHLPALAQVQERAFESAVNMDAIELGSNTVVTTISDAAFKGCTNLARLQIRAGKELEVAETAFEGTESLKFIEFTSFLPTDPVAVDRMLVGTESSVEESSNPPVIYASRRTGWNVLESSRIRRPTDVEKAALPFWVPRDSSLSGVWVTEEGVAKAWIVHVSSKDDAKGLFLVVR